MNELLSWSNLSPEWRQIFVVNYFLNNADSEKLDFWRGPMENFRVIFGDVPIDIETPISINKLDVYGTGIENLSALRHYNNLKEFYCGNTKIQSLTALSDIKNLERLCCYNSPITSAEGLESLSQLKRLCLSKTEIVDVNPLKDLRNLEKLALYHTEVSDLRPLENMTKLIKLNISHTKVTSLRPILNLKALRELHCFNTPIPESELQVFTSEIPECIVYANTEQSETEYDDFA